MKMLLLAAAIVSIPMLATTGSTKQRKAESTRRIIEECLGVYESYQRVPWIISPSERAWNAENRRIQCLYVRRMQWRNERA